jgi:hypothetical protein
MFDRMRQPSPVAVPGRDPVRPAERAPSPVLARSPDFSRVPVHAGAQAELERKYGIVIAPGDKPWSPDDLKALEWSLSKLSKQESPVMKGYTFLRWSDPATRAAQDPNYKPPPVEECGLHETDFANRTYKISMYDKCFKDPEATSETQAGVSIERFHMLHEIGHAVEVAELRRVYAVYSKAIDAYNAALDEYNEKREQGASRTQLDRLEKKAKELDRQSEVATKRYEAAKQRTITEFQSRIAGTEPMTDYSQTSPQEAFAEAFAIYKADPKGLKKANPDLYEWFAGHGHLNPLREKRK